MGSKTTGTILAVASYVLGIGVYLYLVRVVGLVTAVEVEALLLVLAVALVAIGAVLIPSHPVGSVAWLDTGWTLLLVVAGSSIQAAVLTVVVVLASYLAQQPKEVAEAVGAAFGVAVLALAGLFTKQFESGGGWIWPGALFMKLLQKTFKDRFTDNKTAEYDALWEPRLHDHVSGWGLRARYARAAIIAKAPRRP